MLTHGLVDALVRFPAAVMADGGRPGPPKQFAEGGAALNARNGDDKT